VKASSRIKASVVPALIAVGLIAFGLPASSCATLAQSGAIEIPTTVKSAPEVPAWRTVSLGLHRSVDAFRSAFDQAHVAVGDSADEVLGRPAFTFAQARQDLSVVVVSVAALGFSETGAALSDIHARGLELGLALCPEEVGPQLRLQYLHQPVGEFLHIAMRPLRTFGGAPVDFTLANGGTGPALLGGEAEPDLVIPGNVRFVFARPYRELVAAEWPESRHAGVRKARSTGPLP
jgi:hypothetical protein